MLVLFNKHVVRPPVSTRWQICMCFLLLSRTAMVVSGNLDEILVEGGKLTSDPYNVFQLWSKVSCGVLPSFHYFSLFLPQFAMPYPVSPDPIR